MGMNPVTIRGEKGSLSIGRLWIKNSKKPNEEWQKEIPLVVWQDSNAEARAMLVDENDVVKIWGKPSRTSEEGIAVVFSRDEDTVTFTYKNDIIPLKFSKFLEGLGLLFPHGELE